MTNKLTDELKITIRDEFIHGVVNDDGKRFFPTVDGLVKRHDVARATLYRFIEKEDLQKTKNRYQTELQIKIDSDRLQKMAEDGKRLDDNSLVIAQGMLQKVATRLRRSFDAEKDDPDNGMASDTLRELSHIAMNAQKIGKLALGQAQEISKVSADVSNPEAFREVLEQLDEIAEARSSRHKHTLQ